MALQHACFTYRILQLSCVSSLFLLCRFHVAAVYQKRKHVLELGLREDGSRASKKASMIARNVARAAAWGASINVRVQEQDGAHDHRVSLGANPFAFSELQLHSRREQPKKSISKKQQGGSGKQNQKDKQPQQQSQSHPEQKDENGTAYCCRFSLAFANRKLLTAYEWHSNAEQETIESPVDWITLDPEKEWLLHDVTYQPQRCWEAILERDKYGLVFVLFWRCILCIDRKPVHSTSTLIITLCCIRQGCNATTRSSRATARARSHLGFSSSG